MTPSPIQYPQQRAPRVKLAGSILVLLQLQDRSQVRARLNQLSVNGGVLQLSEPLQEQLPVEVMFHIGSTTVRAQAATTSPMWATQGCLQPFRFTAFQPEIRQQLATDLESIYGAEPPCAPQTIYRPAEMVSESECQASELAYESEDRAPDTSYEYRAQDVNYEAELPSPAYQIPSQVVEAFVEEIDETSTPNEVVLYFDRPEDAMHFTVALSSVIFNDHAARTREDITKLAREIAKISRVTTKGTFQPPRPACNQSLLQ